MTDQPVTRTAPTGNIYGDASIVYCMEDELVIAGGGFCGDPAHHFIHDSYPVKTGDVTAPYNYSVSATGNGWFVNCYGVPGYGDAPATAFAICLKEQ